MKPACPLIRVAASGLLLIALSSTAGCSLAYYAQAVRGQVALMMAREPIERLLADDPSPQLKTRLQEASAIRRFAVDRLKLPDNGSYRSYVDLNRPFVVWNVVATPEFSLQPRQWCFPVAGCVSYRGYFHESAARRYAAGLLLKGDDVTVRGVIAYSTLGRFSDPVLSSMLDQGRNYLANVIVHELAHQRLYVPGDPDFNEAFASVVGDYGARMWLAERFGQAAVADYDRWLRRRDQQDAMVADLRARLATLYGRVLAPSLMRQEKNRLFADFLDRYRRLLNGWGIPADAAVWLREGMNNADIASSATYHRWMPALRALLAQSGDLPGFYAAAGKLAELSPQGRARALEALGATGRLPAGVLPDRRQAASFVGVATQISRHDGLH